MPTSIVRNVTRLISTPGMAGAYSKWLLASLVDSDGPAVPCATTKIRGWANFSDYWCFRDGISPITTKLLDHCLRTTKSARPTAIDVGAHLGLFSAELAERGFAEIHTFEPAARTFEKLKNNIELSPCTRHIVKLNCMAVGPTDGVAEFEVLPESPATNHVRMEHGQATPAVEVRRVPMTTLDTYCEQNGIRQIDFLKIDTEGLEPFVLAGATRILADGKIPFVLVELCPNLLARAGSSVAEFHHALTSNGYEPRELTESGPPGRVLSLNELSKIEWADVVAVPAR